MVTNGLCRCYYRRQRVAGRRGGRRKEFLLFDEAHHEIDIVRRHNHRRGRLLWRRERCEKCFQHLDNYGGRLCAALR